MTVTVQTPRTEHTGDASTTQFSYNFRVDDASHIEAYLNDFLQTQGVDYTVDSIGASGGTITFTSAPGSSVAIRIDRATPRDQQTDYTEYDPFPAVTHETALDKLTMQVQELDLSGGGDGFNVDANYVTTGNWNNSGNWAFTGTLTFNGQTVATVNQLPDLSAYPLKNGPETITGAWAFSNSVTLRGSAWPADLGTDGFVLKTNGAGVLSWVAQAGGGGFDPAANYTVTGTWDFSNTATFAVAARLANAAPLQGRNNADTNYLNIGVVTTSDKVQLGSNSGLSEGTDLITPPSKPGRIFSDVSQVAEWTSRALGSLLVYLENAKVFKVGIRNPKTVRTLSSNDTLAQTDEAQIVKCTGAGGFTVTAPNLEDGTAIILKNLCTAAITIAEDTGVTLRAIEGGAALTGDRTLAENSVATLHWDGATGNDVDMWGNGIS